MENEIFMQYQQEKCGHPQDSYGLKKPSGEDARMAFRADLIL
jgi:hypothetical protein